VTAAKSAASDRRLPHNHEAGMMLLGGFTGLGFAGYRRTLKPVPIAA
jgi:hypothetical protein